MSNLVHMPFSPKALQKAVEAELVKAVPEGQNGALVAVATAQGVKVAVAARVGKGWDVLGVLEKPYDGPLTGSAMVVKKW